MATPRRINPNDYQTYTSPEEERGARGDEAQIQQRGASAAASAASAEETRATLPATVAKAEADAAKARIDLAESQRTLDRLAESDRFEDVIAQYDTQRIGRDVQNARERVQGGWATGLVGWLLRNVPGTDASDLRALITTLRSPIVLEAMAEARKGSAVGATGFGQLSIKEMELLANSLGPLDQDISDELLLETLQRADTHFRRAMAFQAGFDPRTRAGAEYAGIPYDPAIDPEVNPEGAARYDQRTSETIRAGARRDEEGNLVTALGIPLQEDDPLLSPAIEYSAPPPTSEPENAGGEVEAGRWVSNPELSGVDRNVASIIMAGIDEFRQPDGRLTPRSRAQIEERVSAYLEGVQPGLSSAATNIREWIEWSNETGDTPQVTIERSYEKTGDAIRDTAQDLGLTAYFTGVTDTLTSGFSDELAGGNRRALMNELREENPGLYGVGQFTGAALQSGITGGAASQLGMRAPWMLQGLGENALYGAGSADEGSRGAGALTGALLTPVGNVAGQAFMRPVGAVVGGTMDRGAQVLAQKYGINPTAGNVAPGGFMSNLQQRLGVLPGARDAIEDRTNEALIEFNEGAFNAALRPIGGQTNRVGREGLEQADAAVDRAYREALDGVSIQVDRDKVFDTTWLDNINTPEAEAARRIIQRARDNFSDASGNMTGQQIQSAKQALQSARSTLSGAPGYGELYRAPLNNQQDELFSAFERAAPEKFQLFRAADEAFGNVETLRTAVANQTNAGQMADVAAMTDSQRGRVFTPTRLGVADRGAARYEGRYAGSYGNRPAAELADYGERLIETPSRYRGVTALNDTLGLTALGLGGYTLSQRNSEGSETSNPNAKTTSGGLPFEALLAGAGSAAALLPFSRKGGRSYSRMMTTPRPAALQRTGDLMTRYGPELFGAGLIRPVIDDMTTPASVPDPLALSPQELEELFRRYNAED